MTPHVLSEYNPTPHEYQVVQSRIPTPKPEPNFSTRAGRPRPHRVPARPGGDVGSPPNPHPTGRADWAKLPPLDLDCKN